MFDIGLGEMIVLAVLGLLVFGPDRLPSVIRQGVRGVRDLRRTVTQARRDLSEHIGPDLDDLGLTKDGLAGLDPRTFVRRQVLDGLDDIDDDGDAPARRSANGSGNGSGDRRSAETDARQAGNPGAATPPPPFDPDAT